MALDIPTTAEEVIQRSKVDVQRSVQGGIDPFNKNNVVSAVTTANANRVFDFYAQLQLGIDESLPDSAAILLERWAAIFGVTREPATQSVGNITVTGTAGNTLAIGKVLADTNGALYTVTVAADVTLDNIVSASTLTRVGSLATFVATTDHGLSNNVPVTISGANETDYNVTDALINVTDSTTFTYVVSGVPTTPATGTVIGTFTSSVNGEVQSNGSGADFNLSSDEELSLTTAETGIDTVVGIIEPGFTGGQDIESDSSLRTRMLDKIQNPVAHFNAADIIEQAKTVEGVTRVFVAEAGDPLGVALTVSTLDTVATPGSFTKVVAATTTGAHGLATGTTVAVTGAAPGGYDTTLNDDAFVTVVDTTRFVYLQPGTGALAQSTVGSIQSSVAPGVVYIYPMTDNLTGDGIPSAATLSDVFDAIELIRPANTAASDVNVVAATALPVDVTVDDLIPSTSTLRTAVETNIAQFFTESPEVSVGITDESIIGAIQNTIDPATGDVVQSFTLTSPAGNVAVAPGEIAVQGVVTVSFP